MHKLTYDHHKHRRCIACEPVGGQYPLRAIVSVDTDIVWRGERVISDAVNLECGHIDYSHDEFVAKHTISEHW